MFKKYFIGIDVGGTKIYGGLVSPSGEIARTLKVPTPAKASAGAILAVLYQVIKELLKEENVPLKNVLGIGVAVPGVVDGNGKVVVTPNISLSGTDLKKILIKKYQTRVAVGNDVNFGVMGERWLGAARKANNVVGIFPGTGVGGGVIAGGRMVDGAQGAAAELGHMIVDPHGPACTCGNTGCLEALAGRWAIERDIRAAVKEGEKSLIVDIAGKELKQIKSGALKRALQAKDPLVTRVIKKSAESLGSACVSLNHIFNPEAFIFGGGLVESCGDYILPVIEKALKQDPFFARLNTPRVLQAKLGDDATMLGGVAAVRQDCDPKDLKDAPYYPKISLTPSRKVSVKGKVMTGAFYVRADGKVKDPGDMVPSYLTEADLEEICRKGPEILLIACSVGKKTSLAAKALKFLRKKKIIFKVLPLSEAMKSYASSDERRTIFFNL
ncbi:MAG: ROK family protein [Candidatus Omnitrophica bacterium]|nr:ROK family protein [Candidatus Omnitrophota bacterium]